VRREEIAVKGKPNVVLDVLETLHGPIVNDAISELRELKGARRPPSAGRPSKATHLIDSLAALNLAEDWPSFHRALAQWTRRASTSSTPTPRATSATSRPPHPHPRPRPPGSGAGARLGRPLRMAGYIPYEEMPNAFDPPSGFIATANNKVVGDDYPHFIAYDMADPYRAQRITDLLAAGHDFTRDGLRNIQAETYGLQAAAIRPYLLAVPPAGEREKEGARRGPPLGSPLRAESAAPRSMRSGTGSCSPIGWKTISERTYSRNTAPSA